MKKAMNYSAMLLAAAVTFLSSCKKTDDPVPSSNPDVKLTMNQTDGTGNATTTKGVKSGQANVLMQVTAITNTSTDMSRLYVFLSQDNGSLTSVSFANFTQDGAGYWYYSIPNADRNNFTLDMSAMISSNTSRVTDQYYFYFTNGNISNPSSPSNLQLGAGSITLVYNQLDVVATSQRLYSICAGTGNNAAYNLSGLVGVSTSVNSTSGAITVTGSNADMVNKTGTATNCAGGSFINGWEGQNSTMFVKDNSFDYANATLTSTANAYSSGSQVSTISGVASGDIYIAKLKNSSTYAVIKVTGVTDAAGNNDYIEFDVKK